MWSLIINMQIWTSAIQILIVCWVTLYKSWKSFWISLLSCMFLIVGFPLGNMDGTKLYWHLNPRDVKFISGLEFWSYSEQEKSLITISISPRKNLARSFVLSMSRKIFKARARRLENYKKKHFTMKLIAQTQTKILKMQRCMTL